MALLWKKVAAAIKDRNSLLLASLSGRSPLHNPDLEAAIIKATNHDEHHMDCRNAQLVFSWIRTSSLSLRPLMLFLSKRLGKTRSWVVAIKGLMIMHGIFCCNDVPAAQRIGRLPFDLSDFTDGHSDRSNSWGFNLFVRNYFTFLDQRSALVFHYQINKRRREKPILEQDLDKLLEYQQLLDILLEIKPRAHNMKVGLILEAMDCMIIEIYDIYDRICNGIAKVLWRMRAATTKEAAMALHVLQKAAKQGDQLSNYLEFCKDFGVSNAYDCPAVMQIQERDIYELEQIINGIPMPNEGILGLNEEDDHQLALRTTVTDNWVIFEDDIKRTGEGGVGCSSSSFDFERETFRGDLVDRFSHSESTFLLDLLPLVPVVNTVATTNHMTDLISFN